MTIRLGLSCALILSMTTLPIAHAYELYQGETRYLNAEISAGVGVIHSQKSYRAINPDTQPGSVSWREGYAKYGFSAGQTLIENSTLSVGAAWVSSGTWGDGDAAGLTNGSERHTHIEEGWARWQSGQLLSFLGDNGVDISMGRQFASVGSGFLIHGDPVSMGNEIANGELDRGGAYYFAPRNTFARTGILRLGGDSGWRSDVMYLKSGNRAQAKTAVYVLNVEHVGEKSTLGATYIKGHEVDEQYADAVQLARKGMEIYSVRGEADTHIEGLRVSGEYARQKRRLQDTEQAWFAQARWQFDSVFWKPAATYRYSRFSEAFDPLFYGLSTGLGTWFQGEVAGNYAGPFNSNAQVHHLGVSMQPNDVLTLGLLAFKFSSLDKTDSDLSGREFNLYAEWTINRYFSMIPLVGWYQPDADEFAGGTQLNGRDRNFYSQLLLMAQF